MNGSKPFRLFLRFLKFLLPYRNKYLVIITLSALGTLLGLVNPYLTKLVVDEGLIKMNLRIFIILTLIGAGVFILNGLLDGLRQFLERYIRLRVNFDLNKRVFKYIQNSSFAWFQGKSTGEHLYKINYDVDRVIDFITTTPPQGISLFPRLLLILVIVFTLNWRMALFTLILVPFLCIPSYYFNRRLRRLWEDLIKNSEGVFQMLEETFSHILVIKVFSKELSHMANYLKRLIVNIRLELRNAKTELFSLFTHQVLNKLIVGLITFYGGYQVIRGQMTLGSLTAIMGYLGQLVGLQGQFAHFFQTITLGLVSCQRVAEILEEKEMVAEVRDAQRIIFKKAQINFQNVSFGYRADEFILRNISFIVEPGSHISFAGPSGCGKTTILYLILRLFEPWRGDILVDGYNIRDIDLSSLRGQLGVALQEPFLFNTTIENNIRYAKGDATRDEIIKVAQLTGVDEFVKELPSAYQTVIGENACKLSEGQKQKIAIARAMLKEPKILILDEAMSSMDSASEEKILFNIRHSKNDSTLITVSHRLSTLMSADLVYFLSGPNELSIDKPQNLLDNNRKFFDLFAGQGRFAVYG